MRCGSFFHKEPNGKNRRVLIMGPTGGGGRGVGCGSFFYSEPVGRNKRFLILGLSGGRGQGAAVSATGNQTEGIRGFDPWSLTGSGVGFGSFF